ncbi:MAG: hypothetical protein K2N80_13290 [Lachnospiraceae bacterium]|nr:hypothetical protein [Lachnospiraceae bacterium]
MERDFEREFRELKQNEIPDLWNRIEAGLSEKKNMTQVSQNVIAIDHAPGVGRGRFEKNDFEKGDTKKSFAWRKWGTLIAACVCVVIILPAFSLLIRDKSYSGSGSDTAANTTEAIAEDNAAMDTATAENAENEFYADTAAAAEEMIPENGMTDSAAAESVEGMAGGADTADAGSIDGAASTNEAAAADMTVSEEKAPEASSDATMESAQTQEADGAETSRKEEEKAGWSELTDGQILEAAVIRIQKAETAGSEVLYQAVVEQADADKILESGTQIALVCDDDTEYDFLRGPRDEKKLKEQEMYRVTLRYDAECGRFVVLEAESWEA